MHDWEYPQIAEGQVPLFACSFLRTPKHCPPAFAVLSSCPHHWPLVGVWVRKEEAGELQVLREQVQLVSNPARCKC